METFRLSSISKTDAYRLPYQPEHILYRIFNFYYSPICRRKVSVSGLYWDGVLVDIVEHPADMFVYRIKDGFFLKLPF